MTNQTRQRNRCAVREPPLQQRGSLRRPHPPQHPWQLPLVKGARATRQSKSLGLEVSESGGGMRGVGRGIYWSLDG
jgi:hypothetical protein